MNKLTSITATALLLAPLVFAVTISVVAGRCVEWGVAPHGPTN